MQMICPSVTPDCPDACTRKKLHNKLSQCDYSGCLYKPDYPTRCVPYQEPAQPLTNIPGVEFAKEECYLLPVADVHGTLSPVGDGLVWIRVRPW